MKTNIGRKSLALIALACGMAGCTRSEAPATPAAGPTASASGDAIAAGTYDVCDVADTGVHGDFKGDHLSGKKVEIQRINPEQATAVCIGTDGCPDNLMDPAVLWMIGDEKHLRTVHPFEHDANGGTTSMPHLVQILKDPTDTPPDSCKKGNVLVLRICQPHPEPTPTSQWQCASSAGPHGADAHIEN